MASRRISTDRNATGGKRNQECYGGNRFRRLLAEIRAAQDEARSESSGNPPGKRVLLGVPACGVHKKDLMSRQAPNHKAEIVSFDSRMFGGHGFGIRRLMGPDLGGMSVDVCCLKRKAWKAGQIAFDLRGKFGERQAAG